MDSSETFDMNPNELPPEIRRAFDAYPQIEPSPAFNRAVLDSLHAAQNARRLTLIGRIEELLGLKWWQFAASGMLGALLPAIVLGALLLVQSRRGAGSTIANKPDDAARHRAALCPRTVARFRAGRDAATARARWQFKRAADRKTRR